MTPEKQPPGTHGTRRERDVYDLLAWLELNKRKVAVVAVLFVLLGFTIATMRYLRSQKELKASGELLALRPTLTPQTNTPPIQPAALLKIAEEFSGTSAAIRAKLLAASALFNEGKYAEAEAQFKRFLSEHAGSPWEAAAAYGEAASLEAQNKTDAAISAYQRVATAYANSAVADDAKLAMARIHEARNQPELALRLYNELLPEPVPGQRAAGNPDAYERKAALLKAHPELDTNRVPATASAPPVIIPSATNVASATNRLLTTNVSTAPRSLSLTNLAPLTNSPANPQAPQP